MAKRRILAGILFLGVAAGLILAQRRGMDRPLRHAVRGTRGAVTGGTDFAVDAGMRLYVTGGNAVDAGVAAMFAAAVTEYSHFGFGGEAPILIRTK
ncbi:MAG: gamma-glutamyltransferase, partial [Bryobacteraceae bacterium]|nr:gamma-glutamyltransferase [Bryobacteraceae bacterium]